MGSDIKAIEASDLEAEEINQFSDDSDLGQPISHLLLPAMPTQNKGKGRQASTVMDLPTDSKSDSNEDPDSETVSNGSDDIQIIEDLFPAVSPTADDAPTGTTTTAGNTNVTDSDATDQFLGQSTTPHLFSGLASPGILNFNSHIQADIEGILPMASNSMSSLSLHFMYAIYVYGHDHNRIETKCFNGISYYQSFLTIWQWQAGQIRQLLPWFSIR